MENDIDGNVHDSRSRQQQEPETGEAGVETEGGEGSDRPEDVDELDGHKGLENFEEILEALPEEEREAFALAILSKSWSGLLPDPDSFNKYDQSTQSKMIEWTDAQIKANVVDESARQDRLVDAEIAQARTGQIMSTCIICFCLAAAIAVGLISGNAIIAGAILAIPFTAIIGNLFKPIRSRSNSHGQKKEDR